MFSYTQRKMNENEGVILYLIMDINGYESRCIKCANYKLSGQKYYGHW